MQNEKTKTRNKNPDTDISLVDNLEYSPSKVELRNPGLLFRILTTFTAVHAIGHYYVT